MIDDITSPIEKFVIEKHVQPRLDGKPAYTHLLRVKNRVRNLLVFGYNPSFDKNFQTVGDISRILISALLHDSVEDGILKYDELEEFIKSNTSCRDYEIEEIARNVSKLTKREGVDFRSYMLNIFEDERVLLIKLADRLDNVTFMQDGFSKEKQLEYIDETQKYFINLIYPRILIDLKRTNLISIPYLLMFLLDEIQFKIDVARNVL